MSTIHEPYSSMRQNGSHICNIDSAVGPSDDSVGPVGEDMGYLLLSNENKKLKFKDVWIRHFTKGRPTYVDAIKDALGVAIRTRRKERNKQKIKSRTIREKQII